MDNIKDKDVQNAILKLASDEWFAGNIYKQFVLLVRNEDRSKIAEQMADIAHDELDDHLKSIIDFALANGFDVPSTYAEMKKYADKDDIKLFESCKKGEDALFYVQKGIEAEKRAIETYQKYVDDYSFSQDFQYFKMVVQNNYYDEVNHLQTLSFMKSQLEASLQFG